ncbi:MAG TPA: hypothetical protein VID27_07545 [Blastocatellia bacterium]
MTRLRALVGAAAILLTSLAAPVALATQTDDNVCAMLCCVEDGYCCCKPARPFVKGEMPKGEESFAKGEIFRPCPDGCTNPPPTSKIQLRADVRAAIHQFRFTAAIVTSYQSFSYRRKDVYRYSSPRAPPFSLLSA